MDASPTRLTPAPEPDAVSAVPRRPTEAAQLRGLLLVSAYGNWRSPSGSTGAKNNAVKPSEFLSLAVLSIFVSTSCVEGSTPSQVGPIVTGGGPLVYARTVLRELGPSRYASMIMGLSTIEALNVGSLELTGFVHPNSECNGFPVAMTTGDVTNDGLVDVLVMDPACGNWIASPMLEGNPVMEWDSVLPTSVVHRNLDVDDFDGDSTPELVLADAGDLVVVRKAGGLWEAHEQRFPDLPQANPQISGPLVIPMVRARDSSPGVLFQRGAGRLAFIPLDRNGPSYMLETDILAQEVTEYLKPFEQFDHLTAVHFEDCDVFALGVGIFDQRAGAVPRRVQLLRQRGGVFVAETILTEVNVTTFAVALDEPSGRWFVASIEEREGEDRLELGALSRCGTYEALAVHGVNFDWRTASAPPYYSEATLDRTAGVDIALTLKEGSLEVVHYDGFSLRRYVADDQGSLVEATVESLHVVRDDTAY